MNLPKLQLFVLLWLSSGTTILYAQSRVGAPDAAPNTTTTTSATKKGSAPAKTSAPNLLPVQSYAVIDLGGPSNPNYYTWLAMDDSHNIAFAFDSFTVDGSGSGNVTVQTFSNGTLSSPQTFLEYAADQQKITDYEFSGLRPTGEFIGEHGETYIDESNNPGQLDACSFWNGSPTDYKLPAPYFQARSETYVYHAFATGSYGYHGSYDFVTKPDGNKMALSGGADVLCSTGKQIIFDAKAPDFATDTDTVKYIRQNFLAADINDTGSAIGSAGPTESIWDGQHLSSANLTAGRMAFCLNNQNWFLTDTIAQSPSDGGIWHAGVETKFTNLLKGGAWEHQLQQIVPQVLSNQSPTDGSMYVVTQAQDTGKIENVLWRGAPTAAAFQSVGLSAPIIWQPYLMQFPEGVIIQPYFFEVISSSGVIAAIGNSGKGDNHALLLVPIALRLLNGLTVDFDGQIVKNIIQAPENPNYSVDVAQQPRMDSEENYHQDTTLAAKPPGSGRATENSVAYDLMVAAQAPLIPWLHYKWKRDVFDYEWLITKKRNPARWEVFCRFIDGPHPDANDSFSNDTPSAVRKEFYNYDDSGMLFDPSTGDPAYVYDSQLNVGDYRYCEKVFSYRVAYSIYMGNVLPENAQWIDGVEMFCSQKILVQEIKKSNLILQAWAVKSHTFVEGKINPRINVDRVRQIVGGNLPITLLPDATQYNQVNPPDTDQVDTSH